MSTNQHEESEDDEYDISSSDGDCDSYCQSDSESESEDEEIILARLRARKKKAVVTENFSEKRNISLLLTDDDEVEEQVHDPLADESNEVLHIDSSSRSHSITNEDILDKVDLHDNTAANITTTDTYHLEEDGVEHSHVNADHMIHDESVSIYPDDDDTVTGNEFLSAEVEAVVNVNESEIKEEIEQDNKSSLLDSPDPDQTVHKFVNEEISDETEEICYDSKLMLDSYVDDKDAREDKVEEISDRVVLSNNLLKYDSSDAAHEEFSSHLPGGTKSSEIGVGHEGSSTMPPNESAIKDDTDMLPSIVIHKADRAEQKDTVTYEDPPTPNGVAETTQHLTASHEKHDQLPIADSIVDTTNSIRNESDGKEVEKTSQLSTNTSDGCINSSSRSDGDTSKRNVAPTSTATTDCMLEADCPALRESLFVQDTVTEEPVLTDSAKREDNHDEASIESETEHDSQGGDILKQKSMDEDEEDEEEYNMDEEEEEEEYEHELKEGVEFSPQQEKDKHCDSGVGVAHVLDTSDQDEMRASDLEVERQKDVILTMVAEVERMRHQLESSEKNNADLLSQIAHLEQMTSLRDDQMREERLQFDAEMEKVTKQRDTTVEELAETNLQVQDLNKKIADLVEQAKEDDLAMAELSMKLSDADCSFVELNNFVQQEPARQQEAISLARKNVSSELETCKGLRPSIATQTEPDAVLVQTQDEVSALSELNTSLKDDVDGLNYKIEELEGELAAITEEYSAASAKCKTIASTVVNHEDRTNVLVFKLEAANNEINRSNIDYQDLNEQFNESQKQLKKSANLVESLQAQLSAMESSNDVLVSQVSNASNDSQILKDKIILLKKANTRLKEEYFGVTTPEKAILKPGNHSPELLHPCVEVLRSTVAAEPDQVAHNFVEEPIYSEPLFPGMSENKSQRRFNDGATKTTKKQQASENFRKQQASASESSLPALVKNVAPANKKKKKVKKLKSRVVNQFDDHSSVTSSPKKSKIQMKKCLECACRIKKGEAKVLSCELQSNLNKKHHGEVEGEDEDEEEDSSLKDSTEGAA